MWLWYFGPYNDILDCTFAPLKPFENTSRCLHSGSEPINLYSGVVMDLMLRHAAFFFVCVLNQISCSYFINSGTLASDKPDVLSHFGEAIGPWRWWDSTAGERDASFGLQCYCLRLGPGLQRESLPLMENYCLPLRTHNRAEYGSALCGLMHKTE